MKKILFLIAAIALYGMAFTAKAQMQQLPNDPAVRKGQLENGLTYYIRHNDKPASRAEFYLATNVGAIQETPDQDGLAHFLEHMCFNGTKNFPGKAILDWLQSIGASFGGNVNASTGIDQTQYMLNNIPLVRETVVDTCLLILHDYSHFVTNDPKEIDKERPVIIEERRSRRNAQWRTFERSLPYLYGDTKYSTCTLIGSQENLENFKPESLVSFYRTWYRPDMQAVVVVGDVDVDKVEAAIKRTWADIPAAENPKAKDKISMKDFTEPRVGVLTDPETTVPQVEILWESDARDEALNSTTAGFSIDLIESIISGVMSERFNDITSKADAPFLGARFGNGKLCEAFEAVEGMVALKEDNILGGFTAFMTELEKMKRFGFSDAEVTRAKDNILASYEKAANEAASRKNPEFVHPLVSNFFDNYSYMEPQAEYDLAKAFMAQISAPLLNQMISQIIPEDNLVVVYSGPEKQGIATPSKEELLKVIETVKEATIEAPAEETASEPLMDPSVLKGSPVKKTRSSIYGSTEWILKNGVKVVVLPTDHKKDQILFNLYKAGGQSLIPTEDMASFESNIYGTFDSMQGVSKFKSTEVTKMLSGKNVSVGAFIDGLYNGVSGSSSVKDLETAFQLLYLQFTDPRFDPEEWDNAMSQLKAVIPNALNTPAFKLQRELNDYLYGNNPRREFISEELISKASLETVEKNYRKLFADAAGATMVITGDVDLQTLKPLVEKYIGSLPKGKKAPRWKDVNPKLIKGENIKTITTDMETPKSTVLEIYSDYRPYTVKDEFNLKAVSYVLDQIYVDTMREDEGGTYGASSAASAGREPEPIYLLQVSFECKPEMADKLRELARSEFRKLAENGPTDEQFTRTIENFKKNVPENRISNSYWMNSVTRFCRYGIDYDKEYEAAVNGITKESIKEAARRIIESGNFIEFAQMPGKTTE
ncbi:MAG: insulinase family protein [Bacteroidales bacterium]|nr:insulinase family protein [Bacteroidales bacterium]